MDDARRYLAPLALTLAVLQITSAWAAGDNALPFVSRARLEILGTICVTFLLHFFVVALWVSIVRARRFQDAASRQIDVRALWRSLSVNPVTSVLGVLCLFVAVLTCGNLVEVYRTQPRVWHDALLWDLERPLFEALLASPLNVPRFWDLVYFLVWSGFFTGLSLLFVTGHTHSFFLVTTSLVWAFILTRVFAIFWPTQGPVFFVPGVFELSGTISAPTQDALAAYMEGRFPQNGLLPGTMAMPSLHVAIPFVVTLFLGRHVPHALWFAAPWFFVNWASTVFLGWHYALDGIGGMLVASVGLAIARVQLHLWAWLLSIPPVQSSQGVQCPE